MTKMSAVEAEKAMRRAIASLAVEGMELPEEAEHLIRKNLMGEISHEEFLRVAKKIAEGSHRV